jgi:hypothetical protein
MTMTVRNNNNGTVDYLDNADDIIFTIDPINRKVIFAAGAILDLSADTDILDLTGVVGTAALIANAVTAAKLTTTLATGYIPLPLFGARKVTTNDVDVIANAGGILAKDTAPILERVNLATDKALRIRWAAASVVEIMLGQFALPADLDTTQPLTLNVLAQMGGATDTPTLALGYWPGVGGANGGGNTGALSSSLALKTASVAAPGTYPSMAAITLTPAAHGTDALWLYGAWASYTRK